MEYTELDKFTQYSKLAAWQTNELTPEILDELDHPDLIVSVNGKSGKLPNLKHSIILYATDYNCADPVLERLAIMQRFYKRPIGLSDHSIGLDTCFEAIDMYEVPVIEKHFTMLKNMEWDGHEFRDTVHACDPSELMELSRYFKKQKASYKGVNSALYSFQ